MCVCSCLKRGEAPSTPGFDDVFDVFEVVGDLVGGVTGPIEAAFLLSSVSWVLDTKDWAVRERAAREEPKEEAEVGGRGWGDIEGILYGDGGVAWGGSIRPGGMPRPWGQPGGRPGTPATPGGEAKREESMGLCPAAEA